ncbi:EboA domain-containing protein [Streptomyces exfoliatus]|uniref:EboA domain-containing protein n=1 Tax=Streptomyces exfoliatus TaxID=1905 RepID=UPI003C3032D6
MIRPTQSDIRKALAADLSTEQHAWLAAALRSVQENPPGIDRFFAAAGRGCGRSVLTAAPEKLADWTRDDAARALLLVALPPHREAVVDAVARLYRSGDAAERRAVLRALPLLDIAGAAVPLVQDALRANDSRLITVAMGPYAQAHLDQSSWRQGVLKCLFLGIPLTSVFGLAERVDTELVRMATAFAEERTAAGRTVPPDVDAVLSAGVGPLS